MTVEDTSQGGFVDSTDNDIYDEGEYVVFAEDSLIFSSAEDVIAFGNAYIPWENDGSI